MIDSTEKIPAVNLLLPASKRGGVAILSVGRDSTAGILAEITEAMRRRGLLAVPDTNEDGSHVLRISGFKTDEPIVSTLNSLGIKTNITRKVDGGKSGIIGWLKDHSLRISGVIYLIADASMILSGLLDKSVKGGRAKEVATGGLWMLGGLASARYGNPALMKQITNFSVKMNDFLTAQGATIPNDSNIHKIAAQNRGLFNSAEQFLYSHPSEVHNGIYAIGSGFLISNGIDEFRKREPGKNAGWQDIASGSLVAAGGVVGGFVKEKEDGNVIQKHPLAVSGWLYGLNNLFGISKGLEKLKNPEQKTSGILRLVTVGLFLIANSFMAITSRGHTSAGKDEGEKQNIIQGLAAEVIASQPESMRASLITKTAEFLSSQPETKQDKSTLEARIARKVVALEDSPWKKPNPCLDKSKPAENPTLTTKWQDKARSIETAQPTLAI